MGFGDGRVALVLEDDEALSLLIKRVLMAHGFQVEVAFDGLEGLRRLETVKPELVICDVMMPHLDGVTFTQAIKSYPDTERIKVIFLSARTDVSTVVAGMKAGAVEYLPKPFRREEFLEVVRRVVED